METMETFLKPIDIHSTMTNFVNSAYDYWIDTCQRTILFMDLLRKRGNIYIEHMRDGLPPVLTFDYEVIMDGRDMERPVNYALAKIIPKPGVVIDPDKRPVVVIDPRAGHGPGIGGSKKDSQIGIALEKGHPVYFVLFYPDPMPGQTMADVQSAEVKFIEEVGRRHPKSGQPTVIGNCQAGWAVALLGADRPDITGPMVLNGSPLSYWAGKDNTDFMRYRGGLLGGSWMASLLSDLGNGKYDGAYLVMNFESLNPANTYWAKQYNLYSQIDTEEDRYLNFEKWWNGYFIMTTDEIQFILNNLFVGNKLEQGKLKLSEEKSIDLKNLRDPVIVFASKGDNITPPQQALNWIAKVYGSVEEIKRHQQVIVYRVHEKIGHLGIFVSASVANKEHKEIIGNMDLVEYLSPGLYEMIIEEGDIKDGITDYLVRYEERDIADILKLDDGLEDEEDFGPVAKVSELNNHGYKMFMSPWVRMFANDFSAEVLKHMHPMRVSRYVFSDFNPMMTLFKTLAPEVKAHRRQVSSDNPFVKMEKTFSDAIITSLDRYRDIRDVYSQLAFKSIYGNEFMKAVFGEKSDVNDLRNRESAEKIKADAMTADRSHWMNRMEQGSAVEGFVRVIVAVTNADRIVDRREYDVAENFIRQQDEFKHVTPETLKRIVKDQARILQTDHDKAIQALNKLLTTSEDRLKALEIAGKVIGADHVLADEEKSIFEKLEAVLKQ